MPALDYTSLAVQNVGLTAVADTVIGTSAALTSGRTYLVVGTASAANTGNPGDLNSVDVLLGGTVHARMRSEHGAFSPSGALAQQANGAQGICQFVCSYTAGASETIEARAWADVASGDAYARVAAIDVTDLTVESVETANSDTIVDTPTSGWETVGSTLTFTAAATDYIVWASVELVGDAAASSDEFSARLNVDGSALDGTELGMDIGTLGTSVSSVMWARRVTLSAGSVDIEVEVNGTNTGGNIGARRIRLFAVRADAFVDTQQASVGGASISPAADDDPTGYDVDIGDGTADYLLLASAQGQGSFWAESFFVVDSTELPTNGWGNGSYDGAGGSGPVAADDMFMGVGLHVLAAPDAATNVQGRFSKLGSYGVNTWGTSCARTEAGNMYLLAVALYTPDAGVTLTPSADRWRFQDGASSTALGALTETPAPEQWRWSDGATDPVLGSVSVSPTASRWRWSNGAESVAVGGISRTVAAEQWRFTAAAASLVLGAAVNIPASSRWRWSNSAALVALGAVQRAPAADQWRWSVPDRTPSLTVGGAPIVLTPGADRWHWRDGSATADVGGVSVFPTPDVWRWASTAPAVGSTARPSATRWRWQGQTPVVAVGAVSLAPAGSRWRWVVPDATLPGFALVGPFGVVVDTVDFRTVAVDTAPDLTVKVDTDGLDVDKQIRFRRRALTAWSVRP